METMTGRQQLMHLASMVQEEELQERVCRAIRNTLGNYPETDSLILAAALNDVCGELLEPINEETRLTKRLRWERIKLVVAHTVSFIFIAAAITYLVYHTMHIINR